MIDDSTLWDCFANMNILFEWLSQVFTHIVSFIHIVRTSFIHCFHEIPILASIMFIQKKIGFSMDPYCEMDSCTFGTSPLELYKRGNCFLSRSHGEKMNEKCPNELRFQM